MTVQPGVVLDDLNAFLKPHGVYFAANLSPSNRATLGGMVSTDASGEGSRLHGKTSQHVLDLEVVLRGGIVHRTARVAGAELDALCEQPGLVGQAHKLVREIATARRDDIASTFPKLRRYMTGYNLVHMAAPDGSSRRPRSARGRQRGIARRRHRGAAAPDALRAPPRAPRPPLPQLRRGAGERRVAGGDRPGIGGDPRRDGARTRQERRHLRPGARLSGRRPAPRRPAPSTSSSTAATTTPACKAKVDALLAEIARRKGTPRRAARPRPHLEARRAREPLEPAQEGRRPAGQRAGAAQARALRGGYRRPAREPPGVRARVPGAARRRGPAVRHVRPRRRRLPARAARARPERPGGRGARAAHHRRRSPRS